MLSDTTRATVLEALKNELLSLENYAAHIGQTERVYAAIAEIEAWQEWTPVEDGDYTDGTCGVRVRGRSIGISSAPSIASSYYGGDLPNNMRLCQRTGSQEVTHE